MSKAEQMSLCGFAKKMENELFANARTKVLSIDFNRFLNNTGCNVISIACSYFNNIYFSLSPNTII